MIFRKYRKNKLLILIVENLKIVLGSWKVSRGKIMIMGYLNIAILLINIDYLKYLGKSFRIFKKFMGLIKHLIDKDKGINSLFLLLENPDLLHQDPLEEKDK